MNSLELEMIGLLKNLKENYGVVGIKAEFESEGSRIVELMRLKDVIDRADLPLTIKIGGCEAVSNIYDALSIGAKGIVAPMCETAYAVSKFLDAIETFVAEDNRKDIEFGLTFETITAYRNIDEILALPKIKLLQCLTFGRVDFTGSLGKGRDYVDSDDMGGYCNDILRKVKRRSDMKTTLGGAISYNSIQFIKTYFCVGLLDRFETRKVIYGIDALPKIEQGLTEGIKFELAWLISKRRYYHRIHNEDEKRITMLEERLK